MTFCGARMNPSPSDFGGKPDRFDIEDTRATRRSRYRQTSKLRNFEVGTLFGAVSAVSYLCGVLLHIEINLASPCEGNA